ncbi:putative membrane protein [Propionispora sp. 2/2-37]|nr:putative membrane protein [Propionispora sp. 2/2-37]
MDMSMETLFTVYIILLGLTALFLILRYVYSKINSQKSLFQKPISYVEIRTWRKV